jgi:hypothetical protein
MPAPKCPSCNSDLLYVQRVYEYHSILNFEVGGDLDLNAIEDSDMDCDFEPYLWCEKCCSFYSLVDLSPIKNPREPAMLRVLCKFCHKDVPMATAHAHDGGWVGDECCWDERLRSTE